MKDKFSLRASVTNELFLSDVDWMATGITRAQLLALRLGRLKDQGRLHHSVVSMAKMNNVDIALQTVRDMLGRNGSVESALASRVV
ncbi:MAG: hypothetical protein GY725_18605 [bacterium]|nr:hypothetical protein [bacterium]